MSATRTDKIKSALASSASQLVRDEQSPDEALGDLFTAIQTSGVYADGKTGTDLVPRRRLRAIRQEYELERDDPDFSLPGFIARHFYQFEGTSGAYQTNPQHSVREHITSLWPVLERRHRRSHGSLIGLPYAYVAPGGRFSEQFYWDSYFIMLGLAADERWDVIEGMIKNYAYMLRRFGAIPTANRTYFISRSQPPFFALMVKLLARHKGRRVLVEYLPYLLLEHRFWMKGRNKLSTAVHRSVSRVVQLPSGALLNRYYDNKSTPRPESLREDVDTAAQAADRQADRLYLHLRAAAESGWDFSSRWFRDSLDLRTVHAADIIPVDLNSLLYELEQTIAEAYRLIKNPLSSRKFAALALRRAKAIDEYCWDEATGTYDDYNFHTGQRTGRPTLAMVYPLYVGLASQQQADKVAAVLARDFLRPGGLVTSLIDSGQQWDAPNGWAPLQYVAIEGLRRYGHEQLARTVRDRWVELNKAVFTEHGKLVEKYNVEQPGLLGGGGEYPLQDGFGWTNGVLATLLDEQQAELERPS